MENAYVVRYFWKRAQLDGEDAWTILNEFQSILSNDSYSSYSKHGAWEPVLKLLWLHFYELSLSSIT
jgi:hypothetical protein